MVTMRRMRHLFLVMSWGFVVFWSGLAHAQSPAAVRVLFHGGQSGLYGLDLAGSTVVELGESSFASEAVASLDMKWLPGDAVLLGQASGLGFAVYDSNQSLVSVLDPQARYRDITRVAVASYSAFGVPSRVLIGDSFSSVVTIRDLQTQQTVWYRSALNGTSFGIVSAVAALPDNHVLLGLRWDDIGLSVIDIYDTALGADPQEITSIDYAGSPDFVKVVPEIADLRDVFARQDGTLLVGTASRVLVLDADANITSELPLTMFGIVGEVASVRWTPDGRVVFATFERGAWTRPSEGHRVHWWDVDTNEVISSGSLNAAPAAIDTWLGHGGTGTDGFVAGLDQLADGKVEDLEALAVSLSNLTPSRGDILSVRVVVSNLGQFPVPTLRFEVEVGAGTCEQVQSFPEPVGSADGVIVYPAATYDVLATRVVSAELTPGAWCLRATVTSLDGELLEFSPRVDFEVIDAVSLGETVDQEELDFRDAPDMGADAGDMGPLPSPPSDDGCGCSSVAEPDLSGLLLLLAFVVRRRLRRDAAGA